MTSYHTNLNRPRPAHHVVGPDSPPPTPEERLRIPSIAEAAYLLLEAQDHKMMPLGEFIDELREVSDYDIRAVVIDETLAYMASNAWVALWKDRTSDEAWISVIEGG
ncbi:hypothetical protein JCM24511_01083 [Saitozyma sp. JCM 24511]|nr:hypothetical protein JCM24511_01083 [Saitozyma sp. JCM 24511]